MREFILDKSTKILKFGIAIDYEVNSDEILIETDLVPNFIVNKWNGTQWEEVATNDEIEAFNKYKIQSEISRAEFYYGLRLQGVKPSDVLVFIDEYIQGDLQIKAEILFTQATVFEYYNEILNLFVSGFNQYLQMIGKTPIVFDDIFINGIKLNE